MTKPLFLFAVFAACALGSAHRADAKPPIKLPAPKAFSAPKTVAVSKPKPLAREEVVELRAIKNLVPIKRIRGDREFGGNGPDIHCKTILRVAPDGRSVVADVYFEARETKGDHSTVREMFSQVVFRPSGGKKIDRLVSPSTSTVNFRSKKAGFQLLAPGEDVAEFWRRVDDLTLDMIAAHAAMGGLNPRGSAAYRLAEQKLRDAAAGKRDLIFRGNHVHNRTPASGPVALMSIVGDTGGDDISTDRNGKDDTRIEAIQFKDIRVRYR